MRKTLTNRWSLLLIANALAWCMLLFYQATIAAPPGKPQDGRLPFANPVAQRNEMIEQLRQMNQQLQEQNALLKSGRLTVVVADR